MDSLAVLKAMKEKMKSEAKLAQGSKRFVTKAELEAAKLSKLREEEEQERKEKERKRKLIHGEKEEETTNKAAKTGEEEETQMKLPQLSRDEVIRRLRALGQPATLFGERMLKAETEIHLDDESAGGQQENLMLELQRNGG
eukprot:gene10080-7977_t